LSGKVKMKFVSPSTSCPGGFTAVHWPIASVFQSCTTRQDFQSTPARSFQCNADERATGGGCGVAIPGGTLSLTAPLLANDNVTPIGWQCKGDAPTTHVRVFVICCK